VKTRRCTRRRTTHRTNTQRPNRLNPETTIMAASVLRRRNASQGAQELETTAGVCARVGNQERPDKVRWSRS